MVEGGTGGGIGVRIDEGFDRSVYRGTDEGIDGRVGVEIDERIEGENGEVVSVSGTQRERLVMKQLGISVSA